MLVLTRRPMESIRIGDDIEIIIYGIKGNQVRLGISAPEYLSIDREENYEAVKQDKINPDKRVKKKG